MTVEWTEVTLDLSGSDPQARAGVNSSWACCRDSATIPVLCCLDPDIPHNQGCHGHIRVVAPKGTLVNAEWPGATAAAAIVPADAISDSVWKCLAQAIPEKVVGGIGHVAPNCVTFGIDRRIPSHERPFTMILFTGGAGGGASIEYDGRPYLVSIGGLGGLKNVPIEVIESCTIRSLSSDKRCARTRWAPAGREADMACRWS